MQFQRREFSARKLKNTILVEKGVHSPKKTENWKRFLSLLAIKVGIAEGND